METENESELLQVFNRSLLTHSLSEYWVSNYNYKEFYNDLKASKHLKDKTFRNCSFKLTVDCFGKKVKHADKVKRIERLSFLPFEGDIKMDNPDVTFYYFEYYGHDKVNVPETPHEIMFGRWIADNDRRYLKQFNLKDRKFIANTTMDPLLSFLMSNIAKVNEHHLVYDPFVGSGGILVPAAFHGAYVWGVDIDYLLLHALSKPSRYGQGKRDEDESVLANFIQYKLESKYQDIIVADSASALFRENLKFDAIITDPPYGKRESRERIGTEKDYEIPEDLLDKHFPAKLDYSIDDIYIDLMKLADKHLRIGGRILFWVPYSKPTDEDPRNKFYKANSKTVSFEEIDKRFRHPSLKLVSFGEQKLTEKYSRILVAMERI